MIPNLLPGLIDKRTEFFAVLENEVDDVKAIYDGGVLDYPDFKPFMIDAVRGFIICNPVIIKEVDKKPLNFGGDFIKKVIYYVFGRLNFTADIEIDGTINPEYYVCLNHGQPLSEREVDVLKEIVRPDKLNEACTSYYTTTTHIQNIRIKSGLRSKPELVLEAKNEGII